MIIMKIIKHDLVKGQETRTTELLINDAIAGIVPIDIIEEIRGINCNQWNHIDFICTKACDCKCHNAKNLFEEIK